MKQMEILNGSRCRTLLLDDSNQSVWDMSVSLKVYQFEHYILSKHFGSFSDECAIVKEVQITYLLSQESKLKWVNLQLNCCPAKSTVPVLKRIPFRYLRLFLQL